MNKNKLSLLLPLFLCLSSCNNIYSNTQFVFDTIVDYSYSLDHDLNNEIEEILNNQNKIFDAFNDELNNGLYALNNSSDYIEINDELKNILEYSLSYKELTNGYFNPFIFNMSNHVKKFLNDECELNHNYLLEQKNVMDNSYLDIDDSGKYKIVGGAKIDLGAIAKGYSLSTMKNILDENNVKEYLFNFGHSSILVGKKYNGEPYRVKLSNSSIAFECENTSIGTSSILEQYKIVDTNIYSHIVNPKNASIITANRLVVVLHENPILSDCLSTSFMNMSIEEINNIRNEIGNLEYFILDNHSRTYKSPNFKLYV